MESLKGGHILLDALADVQRTLGRPVHVTFVGDGRCSNEWKRQAAHAYPTGSDVSVDFTGWVSAEERDRLFAESDVLVVPSLWPEPFALIGVEAAACGLPAAAFDVGGISEWLKDGVNGCLASATGPRPQALASAIVECLRDPAVHAGLRRGALEIASRHTMQAHVGALMNVLAGAAARPIGNADDAA
jgi:glycosyltransferase involved in cell wall biosynthesis